MLETHIVMSSLISCLVLTLIFCLTFTLGLRLTLLDVLFLNPPTDLTIAHMVLVHKSRLEPRHFGYDPRPHHGDRFPRRPGVPAGGSFPHIEPRHLDGPCFPHRGSRPT
jgi:hypothetical protein